MASIGLRCDGAVFSISFQWTPSVLSHLYDGEHDQSGSFFPSPRAFLTPAGDKPITLCPRLLLRPLPSARLARPSLLPFIPPLPAPGRPAESLAWRCVAGALLGAKLAVRQSGDNCSNYFLQRSISACKIILEPEATRGLQDAPRPPQA